MRDFFENKIVWITGASSGIGEALAYEFSRERARLILSSRNRNELERVKQNCEGDKDNIVVLPMDLSHSDEIKEITSQGLGIWGSVDYLVLNAGIVARDFALKTGIDIDRRVMETNYFGAITMSKCILPAMIKVRKGHIAVISSLSGKYGVPKLSAYSASKHALQGFFDSLRTEIHKYGINITIIIPGFINTSIIRKGVNGKGNVTNRNLAVNEKGMSPQKCAVKIIKAIKKNKQEALIGGGEILSVYINRFFPRLFRAIISKHPIKKIRSALGKK